MAKLNKMEKMGVIVLAISILSVSITAVFVSAAQPGRYANKYTSGPFMSPEGTSSLNWNVINDATTPQTVRVTIYECLFGPEPQKRIWTPGTPVEFTLNPGESYHNANNAYPGSVFEIVVETNSKLVFPSAETWNPLANAIPGSQITSSQFIREMP